MVVILLGPPGVGKGTQAVRLADSEGWAHVSTGDLLRSALREGTTLGEQARGFMNAGELVPDALIMDLVREHLAALGPEVGILFDGFPRTTAQAGGLDAVLAESGRKVDTVVLFEASDDELVKRLSGRRSCPECGAVYNVFFTPPENEGKCDRCGAALQHREDDAPGTVERRLQVYQEQTAPLVAYYQAHPAGVVRVPAEQSVDAVHGEFRAAVGVG